MMVLDFVVAYQLDHLIVVSSGVEADLTLGESLVFV
jgi:hypothetical protein